MRDMPLDAMTDQSDEALLRRFAQGDRAAARALTLRLTPKVMGHAYRLLGQREEAEDIAQEAMLRLWRVSSEWREGEARVTTWLYRVVANLCTDRLRRRDRITLLDKVPDPPDDRGGPAQDMQSRARVDALQNALNALPERQRQAVVLRHIEEIGNPEIAEIMGISVEAVESLTARGKRALSVALSSKRDALGYVE
jgi:RNA polymerase sigma-70 factor (ECF subfamily)